MVDVLRSCSSESRKRNVEILGGKTILETKYVDLVDQDYDELGSTVASKSENDEILRFDSEVDERIHDVALLQFSSFDSGEKSDVEGVA